MKLRQVFCMHTVSVTLSASKLVRITEVSLLSFFTVSKLQLNTCTGTLNDTNYHKVMTCALYIKWQHYIIIPKPSYYYEHYLL
jgi:hypothetical protein